MDKLWQKNSRLKYKIADGIYITSKTYKMASITLALYGIAQYTVITR